MKKKKPKTIIRSLFSIVFMAFVVLFFLFFPLAIHTRGVGRIGNSKIILNCIKENIQWFKEETGKWPSSSSEIYEYVLKHNISYEGEIGGTRFRDSVIGFYEPSLY